MWTRMMLVFAFLAVALPLALLLGIHLGTVLVQQAVTP